MAGLVTTRQRPGTAKGYVFVLMEDEDGPVNVIVKPDTYARYRNAVRLEPFLSVRGRLQKDGATLNVIAEHIEALRVPGRPVSRRAPSTPEVPGATEYWGDTSDPASERTGSRRNPSRYLTSLREHAPGIKSWG